MNEKTPQDYANELLKMYRAQASVHREEPPKAQIPEPQEPSAATAKLDDGVGGIQVYATTLRGLYPVNNALVTVFTGAPDNMTVIETDVTDQSGKSGVFKLKTPPKSESQQAENGGSVPYSSYNVSVSSDGYVEQIAMNLPVFSGVVSLQYFDLLPITAAGSHTDRQIINEGRDYNL